MSKPRIASYLWVVMFTMHPPFAEGKVSVFAPTAEKAMEYAKSVQNIRAITSVTQKGSV